MFTNSYVTEVYESEHVRNATKHLRLILDAKYEEADLHKVMENQCQHLTMTQRNELLKLLQKLEDLFDGTLGTWKTDPEDSKLKEDAKPIWSQPYPVPKVHKEMSKKEVVRIVLIWVLKVVNDSEWGAPSFAQLKPKSNRVRLISDFGNLNKQSKQKPYRMSKLNEILLKL